MLGYHAVSDEWDHPLAVRPVELAHQLRGLLDRGYVPTTFTRAVLDPPSERTLAVTFDDACASVLIRALPVLDALDIPGTVFVPSSWVGRATPMRWSGIEAPADGPHGGELRCLDWAGLRRLRAAGWEIGSHTVTHPHLTRLGDEALASELVSSRLALESGLSEPVTSVAYPYGDVNGRVAGAARASGYAVGAGLPRVPHATDALRWPRVGVYRRDTPTRFRMKAAPIVRQTRQWVGR